MDKNKVGLFLGIVFALFHAVWAISIAIMPGLMQSLLDFIFRIHFLESVWKITTFNFVDAIILIVVTFIVGYIFGWVGTWIYKMILKKKE
jgi:hypothetical protein